VNTISLNWDYEGNAALWSLSAGTELRIAGNFTNTATANALCTLGGNGGTLRITSPSFQPNRFFTVTNGTVIFDGAYATTVDGFRLQAPLGGLAVIQVTNNGSFAIYSGGNLRLCQTATGGSSRVDISSGTINIATTSGAGAGDIFVGEAASTTTVFNQNGGVVEFTGNGNNRIAFCNASASANGTYNLNNGLLWTAQITQVNAGSPGGTFNFNGGTIRPTAAASTAAFFQGVQAANIQSGGAFIDTTNLNITIGEALPGVGGLTKLGVGKLTLTGANSYTGATAVSAGALAVTTASTGAGSYSVADGAALEVQVTGAGQSLTCSSLTLGVSGSLSNNFTLNANASTTVPAVVVTGALTVNGAVTVNVTGTGLTAPNTYLLMNYGSLGGTGSFVAGSLPLIAGYVGAIVNDTVNRQLKLVYSLAPQPVKWAVGNGAWDTSSLNWDTLTGLGPTNYIEGSSVTFDDTASGTSPITVTLAGNRSPGGITNSASKTYILAGSANLFGTSVIMNGSGTMVLDNGSGNTFAGITINAGTVQLGNGDTAGSLGSAAIADNGTLALNRTDNLSLANAISGSGGLAQNGSDVVTVTAANSFAGTTAINAGKVILGNASALSTNTVAIASGATLDLNGNAATISGLQPVVVAGSGLGGNGAIINAGADQNSALRNVTLTGDTTVGGTGLIGLRTLANSDPGLIANGFELTKVGPDQFNLNGGTTVAGITNLWFTDLGNVDIQAGTLSFQRHSALGNPTNTITVESGATLLLFSLTPTNPVPTNSIVLNNNATFQGTGATVGDTNTVGGQITLVGTGNAINSTAGTFLQITGAITGAGSVGYGGVVRLSGVSTYTGNTVISNGTLQLLGGGSIASSAGIAVSGGALLDVSGLASTFTLGGGEVLSNLTSTGTISGNANTASGIVGLNYSGSASLAVTNGTLTLASATGFNVDNLGTALASGNYLVISTNLGGAVAGTLPPVTVSGSGIAAGQHASLLNVGGQLYLLVTNHAPVIANTVTNNVFFGTSPTIAIADLPAAAGWSDPDGDAVTFGAPAALSANGTNITSDATYIYYNGALTAEDYFTYTITDGYLTTVGTVYLEPVPVPAPGISNPTTDANGHPTFSGSGIPGLTYGVESATSLTGPWINAGTATAGSDGSWNFTDASQTSPPVIFYRLYYPYSAGSPPQ
jgi:autotransporter-associated beta strand protein